MVFWYILISVIAVSLISLIGIAILGLKERLTGKIVSLLVSFATGAMLGSAFLHLLPEAVEKTDGSNGLMAMFLYVLLGIIIFFIIEKFVHWRHCHDSEAGAEGECKIHPTAYLNIVGDAVHNFMDGIVIATGFSAGIGTGIASTIAIIIHEIPQEIGDYAVLIHSGMDKKKALLYNFGSALFAVLGAVLAYYFINSISEFGTALVPIAAGGFIYIASADLIPTLHKETSPTRTIAQFAMMILGIAVMYWLKITFEVG
ncbi:TPA: ZIP family metal transporter [Candidatus Micrarchaeota archaeon]|nr:ZIP family metal transporter [Candidatus Micrarchaeota archaeon]